jgi:lipopolysaccharide transport system ATP-binding protein
MNDIAIKFENISKQYRLGQIGTGTLSHDLNRWWYKMRGKDDPYLKIGDTNYREKKGESEYVWALRDINFDVKNGEVLGIIGKNGAGKSTLLKILSKITKPSTGTIKAQGRIASLLEVGTGFHPEMTGRENVFMNGAIMGMTKTEINRKFDEIVDFAGVERYVDTPVKRYSSGMTVRLGFAIAAHLEPEILVVDEVLAVGDAEFQKKAIGKMQEVSHDHGRTVLFVSHNMGAVRNLCKNGIVLQNGSVSFSGEINEAVENYLGESRDYLVGKTIIEVKHRRYHCEKEVELLAAELLNEAEMATDEPLRLKLTLKVNNLKKREVRIKGMINANANTGNRVGCFFSENFGLPENVEPFNVMLTVNNHNLAKGIYSLDFNIGLGNPTTAFSDYDLLYNVLSFEVVFDDFKTKKLISKWAPFWGNSYYKQVDIELLKNGVNIVE